MSPTFKHWLSMQTERSDQIGNFARAMAEVDFTQVRSRQKFNEHKKWADIVIRHGEPDHILAFNHAWGEYQTTK